MIFNSIDFALFLPIVFIIYWSSYRKSLKIQNFILVVSSYIFYGWWDWRFLILIFFSTLLDYTIGLAIQNQTNDRKRKLLLWTSIIVNLGLLGFFKYYNFFIDNFVSAFSFFGHNLNINSLNIILPVGISFYTFQTLSYTIDVYQRKLNATKDIVAFTAFVTFFPQLVAGPIERATNLLPQFYTKRVFDYSKAVSGLKQILWGLFKKVVIADNCATIANEIFNNSTDYGGSALFLGALFFAFQIYGDFSGYSDIAIGTSRLFGYDLMRNFNFPYFSRDIAEFWRKWHISLSTWFRDYVYIPLGGSSGNKWNKIRNTFIIFIVSGFWHGANWTFIIWGLLNALFFLPLLLTNKNRNNMETVALGKLIPSISEISKIIFTFGLTVLAWIFFRADNLNHAFQFIKDIFTDFDSYLSISVYMKYKTTLILIGIFIGIEWLGREGQFAIENIGMNWKRPFRYVFYYILILFIFMLGGNNQDFIYFQF
jgi:alginate O-acetyltransferase complex protein AlgI